MPGGTSIRRSLDVALLAGVLAMAVPSAVPIGHLRERATETAASDTLRSSHAMLHALERGDVEELAGALLEDEVLRHLFLGGIREALLRAGR